MFQAPGHSEVAGVVDHGLDAKRAAAFEVGLHPGVPEVGVEGDLIAGAQQSGAVATRRWGPHSPTEDDLYLLGTADVKIVGAQRLKEPASLAGRVEHDGRPLLCSPPRRDDEPGPRRQAA